MSIHLESLSSKSSGRLIAIKAGKPRIFKVLKAGVEVGTVTVALVDGHCLLNNQSQRPVLVNGEEHNRCTLVSGDLVVIGKDTFKVCESQAANPADAVEDKATERVVRARPIAIEPAVSPEVEEPPVGALPVTEAFVSGKSNSDSDRHRRRRSISASMQSVAEPPRKTIMHRVSSVFSAKLRTERSREESLQVERHQLLEEAGRQVLNAQALGLPEKAFSDLLAGRTVTIRPEEIARAPLERWRELSERVALLDAEIAAVRQALNLGPDLGAVRLTAPRARTDLKQREESVFAVLDALRTQEIGPDPTPPLPLLPAKAAPPASVSGRSRVSGRRRQV